jgi:hypothetical protein
MMIHPIQLDWHVTLFQASQQKHAHSPQIEQEERMQAFVRSEEEIWLAWKKYIQKEHREAGSKRGRVMVVLLHDTLLDVQGQETHRALLPML